MAAGDALDTLIQNAVLRATGYANDTSALTDQLQNYVTSTFVSVGVPGESTPGLTTPFFPFHYDGEPQTPVVGMPAASFATVENIFNDWSDAGFIKPELDTIPVADEVDTHDFISNDSINDLFQIISPSISVSTFDEGAPSFSAGEFISDIDNVPVPVAQDKNIPTLSGYTLGDTPDVDLPGYDSGYLADDRVDPSDYAAHLDASYQTMLPEMQSFIDGKVDAWVNQYAPEYYEWNDSLRTKINDALNGNATAIPDQMESLMMTRARARAEQEFAAIDAGLINSFQRSGMMEPPGTVRSQQFTSRLKMADALANQSVDIYVERRKMEVQHLQFVMGLASSQIQSVRGLAINYANTLANTVQMAATYAVNSADKIRQVYDHLMARSELSINILAELRAQYDTKLKASLSVLEKFKIEQEALRLRNDIELDQLKVVEEQIRIQELDIKQYQTLVDVVTKKAELERMNIDYFGKKADIVKSNAEIIALGVNAYKAALDGDAVKMAGEKERLEITENLVKLEESNLQLQLNAMKAKDFHNDMLIKQYDYDYNMFVRDFDFQERQFNLRNSIKDIIRKDYDQDFKFHLDRYNLSMDQPKIHLDVAKANFEAKMNVLLENAKFQLAKITAYEHASEIEINAFQNIASSAVASLNTLVSQAIQSAA